MAETYREEHDRLQHRTDELKREHADLSRSLRPFNQVEHDLHTADLKVHKVDLRRHQERKTEMDPLTASAASRSL